MSRSLSLLAVAWTGAWLAGSAYAADLAAPSVPLGPLPPPGPLPPAWQQALDGLATDPPAEKLLGISVEFEGRHYLTGDEFHADLWYPTIKDLGGIYVGVGSDQAYLLAGWIRPEIAIFLDYDPWVNDLHAVYRAFLLDAPTAAEFLAFWQAGAQTKALERLGQHYADSPKRKWYADLYRRNRGNIAYRLALVKKQMQTVKVPCWLSDDATYAYVRALVQTGRARPLQADLLGLKGVQGVGDLARKLGLPVRVLYLSNAEEYWPYGKAFRANILALPGDERSRVIRTLSTFSVNKDYRYNVQPLRLYQAWLERPSMGGVRQLVKRRKLDGPDDIDFSVTNSDPAALDALRQAKKRRPAKK